MSVAVSLAPTMERQRIAGRILRHHAKSFSWAALLLPRWCRQDAAALYAWCRRCDDAVDLAANDREATAAVVRLRRELDDVYGPTDLRDPVLAGFQDVVRRHGLPRIPCDELLAGMKMDLGRVRYAKYDDLIIYCYRVAGTVGLMMARIMGVGDAPALRRAVDLGIAMQLTNICRDVAEDEARDRVYLPAELLVAGVPSAVADLLRRAEVLYRSGDRGLSALPARCAAAIRAARLIYSDIGRVIAARGFDVHAGRAFVPRRRKLRLALQAAFEALTGRLAVDA